VAEALLLFADSDRSMDLFAAVGTVVMDPFLYAELDGRRVAVLGHIDHASVRAADPEIELLDIRDFGRRELFEQGMDWIEAQLEIARRACAHLGVTAATVSWDFPVALADRLRDGGVSVTVDHRAVERRRRVKTPRQLEGIRRAQAAAEAAMGTAAELVRACADGLTAEAVRAAMQAVCARREADLPDDVIVAVNGQAAAGHDSGSGPIRAGDVVLVDIWPRDRASRCWADMTRTFVAGGGRPDDELTGYWRLAREALDAVVAQVRAGAHGRELHLLASSVFEAAGEPTLRSVTEGAPLPDHGFLHGLGHGVGLDVHEAPGLGLAGDELVAGDVIAVEPGCYRDGFGGVRLEDLLLVTDGGCEVLTRFPYDL
jgi:Xaa-Pro aminopeptidase